MKKLIIGIIICLIIVVGITIFLINKNNNKDENQVEEAKFYVLDGAIYEKDVNLNEEAIKGNIEKLNSIYEKYLKDKNMNVYFSIIPDKTYFVENKMDLEYKKIENSTMEKLNSEISYFDISKSLNLDDYYKTDMHWKQENLEKVVNIIQNELNLESDEEVKYEEKSLGDFYGTYYDEIENNVSPDELVYLSNNVLESCKVYNEETKLEEPIYNLNRVEKTGNKYDLFLSGASSIQKIINENVDNGRKLILFRDSFGSSIAPLIAGQYEEILLIDLRYINYSILSDYIDFSEFANQDVLFLYSSRVINKAGIFR